MEFAGGPASHGSMFHSRGGSYGLCQWPGRVFKNKKMPGHMGDVSRTTQNLKVVKVLPEKNLVLVKGSVPGHKGLFNYTSSRQKVKILKLITRASMKFKLFKPDGSLSSEKDINGFPVLDDNKGVDALRQVIIAVHANQRQGNASTKLRSEVSGSGKKIHGKKVWVLGVLVTNEPYSVVEVALSSVLALVPTTKR